MIHLDSHPGISKERLEQVGGKAATLEALAYAAPDLPIPPFVIAENDRVPNIDANRVIVRGSSVLDFLGGFGVFETLVNIRRLYDAVKEVREGSPEIARELATRRGYSEVPPVTPIIQEQMEAVLYGVMMRHPIERDKFIVELSDSRSMYAHEQRLEHPWGTSPPAIVERMLSGRGTYGFSTSSWYRSGAELRVSEDGELDIVMDYDDLTKEPYVKPSLDEAVLIYGRIEEARIINTETVSVMEFGILEDGTIRLFQYTPVMPKRSANDTVVPEEYSQIGTRFNGSTTRRDGITLPVVRFPGMMAVEYYLRSGSDRDVERIPALVEMLDEKRLGGIHMLLDLEPDKKEKFLERMTSVYIETEVDRVGGEYFLAVQRMDRLLQNIVFGIPTPAAVFVENYGNGLLQHGMARWLYEVPLVFAGGSLPEGDKINIRSNGLRAGVTVVE